MSPVGAVTDDGGPGRVPQADQLSGGDDRAPRGRGRSVALVLLVLLAAALYGAERWESRRQLDALLTAGTEVEAVVGDSRRSLGGLVQYSNGLLARTDLSPKQRAAVLSTFAVDAERFPPRTVEAREALEQVRPLPWDGELRAARAALLARVDAWTGFVAGAVEAPDTLLLERRATRPAREAAAAALEDAADGRADDRVSALQQALLSR